MCVNTQLEIFDEILVVNGECFPAAAPLYLRKSCAFPSGE